MSLLAVYAKSFICRLREGGRRRYAFVAAGVVCAVAATLLVNGCGEVSHNQRRIERAEALLPVAPDSTRAILEDLPERELRTERARARRAVLLTRARFRLFIDETDDSLIAPAAEYFTRHPYFTEDGHSYTVMALFHYAVIKENAGNVLPALRLFLRAESEARKQNDHYFLGYIYRHLCQIYESVNSGKESILYGTRSYEEFLQSPSTSNMAYASYEVGYAYAIVADHERAFAWAKRCLDAPHTSGDPYLRASARMLAGESLVNLGMYDRALDYYNPLVDVDSLYVTAAAARNMALSLHYVGSDERASEIARRFLGADTTSVLIPHAILYDRGRIVEAYKSLRNELVVDSLANVDNARQGLTRALAEFREQEMTQLSQVHQRNLLVWILGSCLLVAVVIIIVMLRSRRLRRWSQTIVRQKESSERSLAEITRRHDKLQTDLLTRENEYGCTVDHYFELLETQITQVREISDMYAADSNAAKANPRLAKRVRRMVEAFTGERFLEETEAAVNFFYDNVMADFRRAIPDLKEQDYRLFLLQICDFSGATVAFVTGEEQPAIYPRRSRLKARIAAALPADEASRFLRFF